jgi:glycine betaine transporter
LNDGLATRLFGKTIDVLAITSISIGLGGSIALGVFQVQDGLTTLGWEIQGLHGAMVILAAITATFILPLTSGLNKGMARLSDAAMLIAILTMMYVLLVGPTPYIMSAMTDQIGRYITQVFHQGFRTYTFFDATQTNWFETWTLTYMVWWLAWSPFVGVFIARISRGRTVREYLAGVILAPTGFSIAWFATFGAASFYKVLAGRDELTTTALEAPGRTTFVMLEGLPFSEFTKFAVIIAAFLFVVTSVVSASYVLSMFSLKGSLRPPTAVKVTWGLVLGALGAVMIASGSVEAVRSVIALGAIPFVFIIVFLVVGLLRAIRLEPRV